MTARALLAALGAAGTAVWAAAAWAGPPERGPVPLLLLYGVAFGLYLAALRVVLRRPRGTLPVVLLFGLLFRAAALPGAPSDDVHRYLWEARVARAGMNPYVLAPDDPELAPLARNDPDRPLVNHPSWTAIYPPVAMLWQALFAWGPRSHKLSLLLAESVAAAALIALLRRRGLPAAHLLVYWWNPLAVFSFALAGHNGALALALFALALLALEAGRAVPAAAALLLSVLSKGFYAACLPAFARRLPARAFLPAAGIGAFAVLPFAGAGSGLVRSLFRFGAEMHYNDSLHAIFAALLPGLSRPLAVLFVAAVAIFVWRRGPADPVHASGWLLGALLLALPTVHPWYFTAMLPLLVVTLWPGWIAMTGFALLPLAALVETAATGRFAEWPRLRIVEYAPLFGWLAWRGASAWRRRWRSGPSAMPGAVLDRP